MKKLSNLFLGFITFVFVAVVGLVLCYFAFPNFKNYVDDLINPSSTETYDLVIESTKTIVTVMHGEQEIHQGENVLIKGTTYIIIATAEEDCTLIDLTVNGQAFESGSTIEVTTKIVIVATSELNTISPPTGGDVVVEPEEPTAPYTLKLYTEENVGEGYNEAWANYAYFELGEYPQTLKSEEVTVTIAIGEEGTTGALAIGNDGARYYYQSSVNDYGTSGWYKFEPIRWLILATSSDLTDITTYGLGANNHSDMPETGEQVLVLSEFVLYQDYFDKESSYTNEFGNEDCDLSTNLNTTFAEMTGLSEYFGTYIADTTLGTTYSIKNEEGTVVEQFGDYTCNLFALGYSGRNANTFDVHNYMTNGSEQLQAVPTAFANSTGCFLDTDTNASCWWLRSGQWRIDDVVFRVFYTGFVGGEVIDGIYDYGVRPSFVLNLNN